MIEFIAKWVDEIRNPVETSKSAFKMAKELYGNQNVYDPQIATIYNDIQTINTAINSVLPYDYASLNSTITAKYSTIPPVGNTTFHKVTLEFLQNQSTETNKRTLALIAQSLAILMINIKIEKVASIVINSALDHISNAGVNAIFK